MPLAKHKLPYYIGAMGVDITESSKTRSIGLAFEIPMLLAAIWILFSWWTDPSMLGVRQPHPVFEQMLWGLFILETITLCLIVDNIKRYLHGNWLNIVIIVFGVANVLGFGENMTELRVLRLLTISALGSHAGMSLHRLLRRNKLGTTLIATFVIIVVTGTMSAALDPGIETPIDGIWWAWVTVTSVGYGDIVPQTNVGKVFGSLIILLGLGMTAMITATFTASLVTEDKNEVNSKENLLNKRIKRLDLRLAELDKKMALIISHLNIPITEHEKIDQSKLDNKD